MQYFFFRHIDKEEYVLSTNQTTEDHDRNDFETVDTMDPEVAHRANSTIQEKSSV